MTLIRCIDFETTGTPTEEDPHAVCEYGVCDVTFYRDDPTPGAVIAELGTVEHAVTNPGRPMPASARAVHHISDEDVADAPPFDAFRRALMSGPPDYFAAHNIEFERAFFGGADIPWLCTYRIALRLWPDLESHSLQHLRYALDLDIEQARGLPPHRAGPDAYVGAGLMARIVEEDRASFEDMVKWSKGHPLLPRITFGKHKGSRWDDVPADYLRWIVDKSDLDRSVKANARHHLKLRGKV